MKKIVKVLFCLVAIVALASCGSNKLPEWADTEVLTENARVLIDTLNDFDYEGVAKIYTSCVRLLPPECLWRPSLPAVSRQV